MIRLRLRVFSFVVLAQFCADAQVAVNWLGGQAPAAAQGVSWGVPWPKGQVHRGDALALRTRDGRALPLQSWPMAFWSDGSVEWSGLATTAAPGAAGPFEVVKGSPAAPAAAIKATSDAAGIDIDTGGLRCRILKQGEFLFESLTVDGRVVARNARLIALREDRTNYESQGVLRQEQFTSRVRSATLEQSGPVRAVVKIEGMHAGNGRQWLPFTVRLYFYAGAQPIRIVHSFVFDGDANQDFLKGLGISFTVPMREELHNRHVRFAEDGGAAWVQPVRLLPGYRNTPRADPYAQHLAGARMPNLDQFSATDRTAIESVPVWNDFKLTQPGPDSFSIDKRTTAKSSWLHVKNGHRAPGLVFAGDVSGGIAVGVKRFWEKYPSSIEIHDAAGSAAEMKVWLWSPDAPAMDLRHYDTTGHGLPTNYEDWKPGWDSALGVANTADLTLWALPSTPAEADVVKMAEAATSPALLVASPAYYHSIPVFGYWSLPDASTPARRWLESQIEGLYTFYRQQVDERSWYGFWDYGDVMHNYDFGRHEWRYDVGGWAWTNTELMPDMYLYYSFLRTGRADIFRMAEDMTRHTGEVDVHHIGRFAPLGSRHNVNHWGDGAKQPRISHSATKRIYYYLTTDDRVGDLMHEQLNADATYADVKRNDTRNPDNRGPLTTASMGTDWASYSINWMTEWERTGDTQWRDRIVAGMKSLMAGGAPNMMSGSGPYDPATGTFQAGGRGAPGYFDMIFGGAEIMFVLEKQIDYPEFWTRWANVCENLGRTAAGGQMTAPRMAAYAAFVKKDAVSGRRAWDSLIGNALPPIAQPRAVGAVHDPAFLGSSVNWQLHGPASFQWALNAIETLELAKEWLPAWEAEHEK